MAALRDYTPGRMLGEYNSSDGLLGVVGGRLTKVTSAAADDTTDRFRGQPPCTKAYQVEVI